MRAQSGFVCDISVRRADRRHALEARDHAALAALMDRNFDLRRRMFGDAALGALNLRMVLAARALGGARLASSSVSLWSCRSAYGQRVDDQRVVNKMAATHEGQSGCLLATHALSLMGHATLQPCFFQSMRAYRFRTSAVLAVLKTLPVTLGGVRHVQRRPSSRAAAARSWCCAGARTRRRRCGGCATRRRGACTLCAWRRPTLPACHEGCALSANAAVSDLRVGPCCAT